MINVSGGCHCGAVRFRATMPDPPVPALDCNCSVCSMTGFLHIMVPHEEFVLEQGRDKLTSYRFGTGTAEHLFCSVCGVKSFYQPRSHPDAWSVKQGSMNRSNRSKISTDRAWERAKGPSTRRGRWLGRVRNPTRSPRLDSKPFRTLALAAAHRRVPGPAVKATAMVWATRGTTDGRGRGRDYCLNWAEAEALADCPKGRVERPSWRGPTISRRSRQKARRCSTPWPKCRGKEALPGRSASDVRTGMNRSYRTTRLHISRASKSTRCTATSTALTRRAVTRQRDRFAGWRRRSRHGARASPTARDCLAATMPSTSFARAWRFMAAFRARKLSGTSRKSLFPKPR